MSASPTFTQAVVIGSITPFFSLLSSYLIKKMEINNSNGSQNNKNSNNSDVKLSYLLSRAAALLILHQVLGILLVLFLEDYGNTLYGGNIDKMTENTDLIAIGVLVTILGYILSYFIFGIENQKSIRWKALYGIAIVFILISLIEKLILIPIIFGLDIEIIVSTMISLISLQLISMGCGGFLSKLIRG